MIMLILTTILVAAAAIIETEKTLCYSAAKRLIDHAFSESKNLSTEYARTLLNEM